MREIKFRVWDTTDKQFLEGHFLTSIIRADSLVIEVGGVESENGDYAEIPEVVLMQYTGLKDKNGVEIYEGDIIHYKTHNGLGWADYDQISEVYWNFGGFGIRGSRGLQGWISQMSAVNHGKQYQDAIEVIGNIYEHPDLLTRAEAE